MAIFQRKTISGFLFDLIIITTVDLFLFLQEVEKPLICMQCGAPAWRTLSLRRAARELSALAVAIRPNGAVRSWSGPCAGPIGPTMPPTEVTQAMGEVLPLLLVETDGNGAAVRPMSDREHRWPNDSPTREKPKETAGAWWICTIIKPVGKWVFFFIHSFFNWFPEIIPPFFFLSLFLKTRLSNRCWRRNANATESAAVVHSKPVGRNCRPSGRLAKPWWRSKSSFWIVLYTLWCPSALTRFDVCVRYREAKAVVAKESRSGNDSKPRKLLTLQLRRKPHNKPRISELVFLQPSPNYCEADPSTGSLGVVGRRCNRTSAGTAYQCQ